MELPGIDPGTSHMQSERSTIWATAPSAPQDVFKHDIRAFDVALIKSVSKKWTMELRGIDPRTSHMLSERSTTWATAPVIWPGARFVDIQTACRDLLLGLLAAFHDNRMNRPVKAVFQSCW